MSMKDDMALLEQQEKDALELARKEDGLVITPAPDTKPDPIVPAPNAELDALKQQLAAEQSRVAELTAKLNSEDGRRGGELRTLREQVEQLRVQIKAMTDEKQALLDAASKPPEIPPVDEEEEKEFAVNFPTMAAQRKAEAAQRKAEAEQARKDAAEARRLAEEARASAMLTVTQRFVETVKAKVPTFSDESPDPSFVDWANATKIKGTPYTYAQSYDLARKQLDAGTIIEVLETYEATKQSSTPPPPEPLKPPKPSKEDQAIPPSSGSGAVPPAADASSARAKRASRIAELEYKLGMTGMRRTATIAEGSEYEALVKQQASEDEKAA